jgi:NitT/TauT family transport system substrate-binding protein
MRLMAGLSFSGAEPPGMTLPTITRAHASALLFGGAALGALRRPARAQTSETLRVAAIPIIGAAQVSMAKDMGFFAKAGIDVEIQPMLGSSAIAAAVLSNSADIGFSAVDTLATAHQKGVSLVIIAPASEYVSTSPANNADLILPANSSVHEAKDLNGKTIGLNSLSGISVLSTRAWIDENGGDSSTCKFVEIPFSTMPVALDTGRVDCVQVTEPFIAAAKKNGRVLAIAVNGAVAKRFLITAWFTTPQWAAAHPDAVRGFAAAIRETAIWTDQKNNAAKRTELLAKYTKIDPGVITSMIPPHFGEQVTPAFIQPLIDVDAKYNKFSTFPAQELIYAPSR